MTARQGEQKHMLFEFIHFSDPQVIPAGRLNYDIDPQIRLQGCIDSILKDSRSAEACIITGDLTHAGEKIAYKVLQEALSKLPMPLYMLMGNHDSREEFRSAFPDHPVDNHGYIQFAVPTKAGKLIGLDTLNAGHRGGVLCEQRLAWLTQQLEGNEPVFLFMHHPPFATGIANMDPDGLQNADEFLKVLTPFKSRIRHIFFGHLHRSVSGNWHGISYSCPTSLVHQTPFDFDNRKLTHLSPEPPQYHRVRVYSDHLVVHAREFLHSEPMISSRNSIRYP